MYVLNLQIVHHRKTGIIGAYLTGIALGMEQRCARKNLDSDETQRHFPEPLQKTIHD